MLIKVTKDHIHSGKRGNPCQCPIALAISECINTNYVVSITMMGIELFDMKHTLVHQIHWAETRVPYWIHLFDINGHVEPINLKVDIPNQYLNI